MKWCRWFISYPVEGNDLFIPHIQHHAGLDIKHMVYMPVRHVVLRIMCPAKIFTCSANICTSPIKLTYTAGKISTCPYWKITCPVGHITTEVSVPWDKIYMPRALGHALMSSPAMAVDSIDLVVLEYNPGSAQERSEHQWVNRGHVQRKTRWCQVF